MTKLELNKLLETAKIAQRAYDEAKHAEAKTPDIKAGTITATSTHTGEFEWKCNAPAHQIVGHVLKTIETAIESLKASDQDIVLKIAIAQVMIKDL